MVALQTKDIPAETTAVLTLPALSVRIGVDLDRVRRAFKASPELTALVQRVGSAKCVAVADVPKVKELLDRPRG